MADPAMLLVLGVVPSTNDVARAEGRARLTELAMLGGVPALAVLADRQTAGRGRAGRAWNSPPATGLYLSIYLRPAWEPARAAWLTLAAALAVRDACEAATGVAPALKWPNDLLAPDGSGRKVGGILVETRTQRGAVDEAVVGIGLNLRAPAGGFPPEIADVAAALDGAIAPAALAHGILDALGREIAALDATPASAAAALVARARAASPLWGRAVSFERDGRVARGIATTWADDGGLAVTLPDGDKVVVHAGDVAVEWGSAS